MRAPRNWSTLRLLRALLVGLLLIGGGLQLVENVLAPEAPPAAARSDANGEGPEPVLPEVRMLNEDDGLTDWKNGT